jgi:hypothetical protein
MGILIVFIVYGVILPQVISIAVGLMRLFNDDFNSREDAIVRLITPWPIVAGSIIYKKLSELPSKTEN